MRIAILCASGLLARPTGGVFQISQSLRGGLPDPEDAWIQYVTHDSNAEHYADMVAALNPEKIVHVGHSLGEWDNLTRFDARLKQNGREIDLDISIDPANSFAPDGPFRISTNVREVILVRTLNHRLLLPRGRDVDHPNVTLRVIYGTDLPVSTDPTLENVNDPTVFHDNIDYAAHTRFVACAKVMELLQ